MSREEPTFLGIGKETFKKYFLDPYENTNPITGKPWPKKEYTTTEYKADPDSHMEIKEATDGTGEYGVCEVKMKSESYEWWDFDKNYALPKSPEWWRWLINPVATYHQTEHIRHRKKARAQIAKSFKKSAEQLQEQMDNEILAELNK